MNKSEEVISILVVDDDTTCLSVISAILRKWNYEVVTVKHPVDALCILRIKGGAFHLVVTDVHMPDMNGFELQQAIAQEFKLPVGLMSADDTEGVESKGMENGAAFFLMKPIRPDNLKDLWQFTDKKNGNQVVTEETYKSSNVITVSGSSVNEDKNNKSDYSREKSPIKEGNDKGDGNSGSRSKKVKVNWTISLHNRFLEALRSIGLERAVPKRILEAMNVPGLTRENVASHLQKYRIFLKRVSDASNKIQRSCDENLVSKTLLGSQLSSRNPSVPTISKFSQKNQNTRQSFLRSIKGHVPSFNASFPSSSSYLKTQSPIHFNGQSNYLANPSLKRSLLFSHQTAAPQRLTSNGLSSMLGVGRLSNQRSGTSNISSASTNFKPLMSNYVGYKISDNRLITESAAQKEHGTCSNLLDKFTNFTGKSHCKNSGNSGLIAESAAQKEHGKVSNLLDEFTNFTGKSHCKNSGISGLIAESEAQKEHGKGSNLLDKFTNFTGKPHCKNSGNSGLIAESAVQKEHGKGSNLLDKFTSFKGNSHCKYSGNSGLLEEDISWSSVFDEIQDISSPFLPSDPPIMLDSTVENGENDSEFIQMYDLQDIDHILSTDQESLNEGTSSNKMIIQSSQPKLNGGENVMNFNFSGGLHQWQASPPVLSFHQTPIQQNGGENVMNFNNISGGMNPWQGSPSIPRFEGTPEQHQSGGSNLISDQCGISTEQSDTFPSSDELFLQRDDVEYLESLLAMGPLGENQGEIFKLN